jgi:perosamine synthetase
MRKIVIAYPYVSEKMRKAAYNTLGTRFIGQGPKVDEFEKAFEKKFHVKNAVAVNSGTAALELAYDLVGIKEGDEVITPVLTCTATNLPLVRRKAKLVFADINITDLMASKRDIEFKITKKTKAIVTVDPWRVFLPGKAYSLDCGRGSSPGQFWGRLHNLFIPGDKAPDNRGRWHADL